MADASPRPRTAISIREILFPCDLSPLSDQAFEHARLLAETFRARLTLFHAYPYYAPGAEGLEGPAWSLAHDPSILRVLDEAAREQLSRRAAGVKVPHTVVTRQENSPHRAILDLIWTDQPDLTVMATHGRDGLAHFFIGSVAEKVVRHAQRPILAVRGTEHAQNLPYRRILVPTDFSHSSRRAFPMAALLARAFGSEILGLHVARPSARGVAEFPTGTTKAWLPTEASLWRFFEPDFSGLGITTLVFVGNPWEHIIATARLEKADLVVMSSRGHDSIADRILGSQTDRVLRHAPCPVLVV